MRPDSQQRRRSRGGSRRPRQSGGSGYDPVPRTPKPVKLGFFQRIAAFFTGSSASKPTTNGAGYGSSPQEQPRRNQQQSSRPERSERSERTERSERQSRKPEIIEVSSPKLYVGNLSFDASESDLFELFNGVGKVQNAEIVSNKYTQKSKGFAFVTLQTIDEARRAVTELHDKEFMGRKLVVSGAKTSDSSERSERASSSNGRDDNENGSSSDSEGESHGEH